MKILLVDDEPTVRQTLTAMLKRDGHEIVEAKDGREALGFFKADSASFDLVFTDLVMPEKAGIELIAAVRRISATVKIIAMSGGYRVDSMDMMTMASAMGANTLLYKPFGIEDLQRALQEVS